MHITLNKLITNKLIISLLALTTIVGLAVHDTKLDALTTFAIAIPATIASYEGAHMLMQFSEAHTHVERVSLSDVATKTTASAPWLTRTNDDRYRRHRATHANQPFGDYHLPILA